MQEKSKFENLLETLASANIDCTRYANQIVEVEKERNNLLEKNKLLELLKKFEPLFDGTLVTGEPSLSPFN